jgi:glyoxylase-like metal-dependent hydrolase (beta-lactamase superfamily II)
VLHTPGHTWAVYVCWGRAWFFTGDTLFHYSIGRTDLPGGNYKDIINSNRNKLLPLPDDTVVYPGHGPATTIGEEKKYNPFLE